MVRTELTQIEELLHRKSFSRFLHLFRINDFDIESLQLATVECQTSQETFDGYFKQQGIFVLTITVLFQYCK